MKANETTVLNWTIYFFFFGVGIYFIIQGEVLSKYFLKRKAFTHQEETIFEHPTIVTYLEPSEVTSKIEYGKDYNISFIIYHKQSLNLTRGTNLLKINGNYSSTIDFEEILNKNVFLVKPSNDLLKSEVKIDGIQFIFPKYLKEARSIRIGSKLNTMNNSIRLEYANLDYDGEPTTFSDKLGMTYVVSTKTEKFVYILEEENCRKEPFNNILFSKISQNDFRGCTSKCRMNMSFGKALDAYIDHFPFCNSSQDETCYLNLMRDIQASIIKKPRRFFNS